MTASRESARVAQLLAALVTIFTIVTLVIAVQQRHRTAERLNHPGGGQTNDFDRWMTLAPAFERHQADYVNDDLPTPPISLLVFAPLAALGRANAQLAWALLKLPLACAVFALAMAIVKRAGVPWSLAAVALVAAGWWLAVIIEFQEGQVNLVTLLPLVAGLYVAQRETGTSAIVAGLLIGLSVAIKVTPIIFVAYFLWRRRFGLAAAALVAIVLWSLVPALAFGWDQNLRWLDQWARIMLVPYVTEGTVAYATSQSIGSFALRLLTDMPAFDSHRSGLVQSHYMNVASLADRTVHQIVRTLMVLLGGIGLWWTRGPLSTLRTRRYVLEIGAVAAFMLWFSERTWIPHYVSFVLTLAAAGMVVSDAGEPTRSRDLVKCALIVFAVVTPFASEISRVFGPDGVDWAKALGVYLWPSVVVTAATVLTTIAGRQTELKSSAKVRALWLLGTAVAAVLFAQTWSRAHRIGGIDLTSYLEASRVVVDGGNPYLPTASYPYIYPLFFAFALIPLAFVPADLALLLWYATLLGALLWTTRTVLRSAYPGLRARGLTPFVAVFFAISYTVIQSNLRNGQANLVVLALCVLALNANRDGSEIRGAFAWATAMAIKIMPAVLVPFFVRRGRWRVVVVAFVTVAALCLLPVATMGTAALSLTRSYLASFVTGSFGASAGTDPLDFSAGGMLVSVTSGVPVFWLRAIGALVPLAVAIVADCRTRANAPADVLAFAMYLAIIPLASPKSEVHHLAFALPAAAVTAAALCYGFTPRRGATAWLLSVSMISYLVATSVRAVADAGYFLSLCALVLATIVLMRQADRSEPESQSGAERPRRLDR